MQIYFAGLTGSTLFECRIKYLPIQSMKEFKEIIYAGLTDIEIGNTYLLLWQSEKLFISSYSVKRFNSINMAVELPNPSTDEYCKFVVPHHLKERISILSTKNVLWEYDINGNVWSMINVFRPDCLFEHAVKIIHCGYNMLLTSFGRLLIMHDQLEITKRNVKFIDIANGEKHIVMLGDNFHVYVSTVRMRQLENGNTEPDIIGPVLVQELFRMKIVQIAAGAFHSAAITEEGHLYTWGSNNHGELGLYYYGNGSSIPQLVRFRYDNTYIEVKVKKVACGNQFTICLTDDGTLWGTGDNSSCQLGKHKGDNNYCKFIKLDMALLGGKTVKDVKCNEKGTAIITE